MWSSSAVGDGIFLPSPPMTSLRQPGCVVSGSGEDDAISYEDEIAGSTMADGERNDRMDFVPIPRFRSHIILLII
jgi:hypothetical protein